MREKNKSVLRDGLWLSGLAAAVVVVLAVSCQGPASTPVFEETEPVAQEQPPPVEQEGEPAMAFQLTSSAFKNGETIPGQFTGDGPDLSPPLSWTDPPEGAKSFALICDDPDAPVGTWVHWVIFNIPAEARGLGEGVRTEKELPDGSRQGINDFRKIGYGGPAPPRGPSHRYFFKLYALDTKVSNPAGISKQELLNAMRGHILAETQLMGRYKR